MDSLISEDDGSRRVVRLTARLNVGGIARHVTWLTAELQPQGYQTLLVTGTVPPSEDDMGYFAAAHGVTPLIIPEMSREVSLKDALVVWKLYRLFVRQRPDVVHTHSAKAGTAGRLAGLLYRWLTPGTLIGRPRLCRFVHTFHGHIFHSYYGPLKTRLFLAIEKLLARLATDRIVVISPQQYREIHEQFGVGRPEQFAIIRLGLDLDAFADWPLRRQSLRKELGVRPTDLLVGIVGRLTEIKNHALFLQAVALYQKERPSTREGRVLFLIIGDGHLRQGLEDQARALGLGENLWFLGTRNDPEVFYPALDVVALTSLNEGTPLTLIEAMANARPVIATAVGGVVDLLGETVGEATNGQDSGFTVRERGVLVRSRDAAAFARGLTWLLAEEEMRREMGEHGRAFVERCYSKERLLADMKGLYEELVPPGRKAPVSATREPARCLEKPLTRGKQPMRVLITGGAGFIGSHLADAYIERGDEVCVLDDLSTGSIANIEHLKKHPRFHYTIGSVHNPQLVAELVDCCDVVFHLAAAVGVKLIVDSPVRTIETNVHGTEVVLAQANKKKKKVLLASTSEVYGLSSQVPFREEGDLVIGATTKGRWSYACSKTLDEFLALAYWREKNLPTVIVRLFNTVGPRQTGHYGMVIPTFVKQALEGRPITVYGDGSQSRCFGYVGDVVEALVKLMDHPAAVGEVFNIGSSEEVTIAELAEMVKVLTGSSSEIVCVPYAEAYGEGFEDMPRRVPDTSKIRALIGFHPRVALEDILKSVIAYFKGPRPPIADERTRPHHESAARPHALTHTTL